MFNVDAVVACKDVFPVTFKLPLTVKPVTEFIVAVKHGCPWFLTIVNVLFEYVKPVVKVSAVTGKFWYVAADIVFAVNPFVNVVGPVTVPPLSGKYRPVKFGKL